MILRLYRLRRARAAWERARDEARAALDSARRLVESGQHDEAYEAYRDAVDLALIEAAACVKLQTLERSL